MEILNCLKTNNETIAVTLLACDPSPLEEGSRDGQDALNQIMSHGDQEGSNF